MWDPDDPGRGSGGTRPGGIGGEAGILIVDARKLAGFEASEPGPTGRWWPIGARRAL